MNNKLTPLTEFFQGSDSEAITAQVLVDAIREVHRSQKEVVLLLAVHSNDFKDHVESDDERFDKLLSAFPDQDTDGHHRYHKALIDWLELRNRTIRDALIKASQVGFIAAMGWILYAVYVAFLNGGPKP